jgi:predicted nucleic acid-binding Zn ribbon protein
MARTKNPKKISAVVGDMCQALGLTEAYHQYKTLQIWNSVVGEAISSATSIERFTNGVLFIRVKNPAWRMELNFRKQDILAKLNAALPSTMVEEIIFK